MHREISSGAIPAIASVLILAYVCQRFLAATRLRRKIIAEMREFSSNVRRARENVRYIGEQVAKGVEEIERDVGEELRITDRLTSQSAKLSTALQRFAELEETLIELLRMDRNRESVWIETPVNVNEEIQRILAAAEGKKNEDRNETRSGIPPVRNPLSKFSVCARDPAFDRAKTPTTPEVRLLSEPAAEGSLRSSRPSA
ncbi:uncharacterized protein LOC116428361 [Nomia melanderi]|uniref:uncharacterized protein LOC116428361 n=1 Tax=Nomia melanderi TaxID=2448451 RepID=UPI0013046D82|nr:uncharacterized protein LOC116428361 [Nomia melanderi]